MRGRPDGDRTGQFWPSGPVAGGGGPVRLAGCGWPGGTGTRGEGVRGRVGRGRARGGRERRAGRCDGAAGGGAGRPAVRNGGRGGGGGWPAAGGGGPGGGAAPPMARPGGGWGHGGVRSSVSRPRRCGSSRTTRPRWPSADG